MNKTLCFFGIFVGLFITDVTYCAKMPPGGIPEQSAKPKTTPEKQKGNETKSQTNQGNLKRNSATDNLQKTKINKNVLESAPIGAMGLGGMQLSQGLYEQDADTTADTQMTAYMQTFRCTYAQEKSVPGGVEGIELPGGNDETMKTLREEYFQLAADLKKRKEALGMEPGIESEVILNKTETELYNNENVGVTTGVYGSWYRAKTGNESDQAKTNKEQEKSAERINTGISAIASGILTNADINMIKTESTSNPNTEKKVNQKQKEKPESNKVDNKPNSKQTQTKQKEKK